VIFVTFRAYFNKHTGRWQAIVECGRDEHGKRKQVFRNVTRDKNTRREALRLGRQILNEIEAGVFVEPSELTVAEYLSSWLEEVVRHRVAVRTYDRYASIIKSNLVPLLGSVKLTSLHPSQVQHAYSQLVDQGLSPATVNKAHAVLHSALKHAKRMGLIARNPTEDLSLPKIRRPEIRALDEDEIQRLLAAAKGTSVEVPILTLLTVGLRRGELLALRWGDVDLTAGTMCIRRTLQEASDGITFKEPKTARASRMVALPVVTTEALQRHRDSQVAAGQHDGSRNRDDLVFPGDDGEPWWPSNFARVCRRVFDQAGLSCRLHDLRHTHATMLLRQGVHPKVVQERLGHANVGITLDIYSHVAPHMQEEAAAKIDAGFRVALAG
jgi:integrase